MNIILTIKSVLNYLYNNLIDLVWTKKIKFADGTELSTAVSGGTFSLFDIKVMSEAIADEGFAFMCKTLRQDLSKNDVPTLYNNILDKYNNREKSLQNFNTDTYSNGINWVIKLDNIFYAKIDAVINNRRIIKSSNLDLSDSQQINLPLPSGEFVYNISYAQLENIIKLDNKYVLVYNYTGWAPSPDNYRLCFLICDTSFNLEKQIGYNRPYKAINTDGQYIYFVTSENDNRNKLMKMDSNGEITVITENFNFHYNWYEPNAISNNGKYMFATVHTGGSSVAYDGIITVVDDQTINGERLINWQNCSSIYNNIFAKGEIVNGNSVLKFYQISDDGLSISLIGSYTIEQSSTVYRAFDIFLIGAEYYIPTTFGILSTTDFTNFNLKPYDITMNNLQGGMSFCDSSDCYVVENNKYTYSGIAPTLFTDTYIINGNTVNIDYYKYNDFKLCISDNGGTNDTNLETVYNYLGYLNYWLLNLTNETITIPRDKTTYALMYVGDKYQDTLFDLPQNDYAPAVTKKELISIVNPIINPTTINNLQDAVKNTVYQADNPTLIVAGNPINDSDWYLEIQVSTNGTDFITLARYGVSNGDPGSSSVMPVVIGGGLYWKVNTSLSTGNIKYGELN